LEALRAANGLQLKGRSTFDSTSDPGVPASHIQDGSVPADIVQALRQLPAHLGWQSARFGRLLPIPARDLQPAPLNALPEVPPKAWRTSPPPIRHIPESIQVYPSLLVKILEQKLAAPARIWLLLKHLDRRGQGWFDLDELTQRFTDKVSPYRVCGKRQLRNLLAQGEGVFWAWGGNGRIWLRSWIHVAVSVQVEKVRGMAVQLPVAILCKTIGVVRAHFYATYHSGRLGSPISRDALADLTHVQKRTQRRYEKIARVGQRSNFAVLPCADATAREVYNWQYGHAVFRLCDHKGQHGKPGQTYLVRQLPNSYEGPHAAGGRGAQKPMNRALSDLLMKGITGNGQGVRIQQRFFANGRLAAQAISKNPDSDIWWAATVATNQSASHKSQFWYGS
jgi:hypothetical protein